MKEIIISPKQKERATQLYSFHNLNNSITKGNSEIFGALGEIVFMDDCINNGHECQYAGSKDFDILVNNTRVDVKTKRTTVKPKPYYNCSIAAFNTSQKTDYYSFVRILEDQSKAYILGSIKKSTFFKKASFNKKGEPDGPKFKFRADCHNLPISQLTPPQTKNTET